MEPVIRGRFVVIQHGAVVEERGQVYTSLKQAVDAAERQAVKNPGFRVYVAELATVTLAPAPEVQTEFLNGYEEK